MPEPPADPTGPVREPGDPLQRPRDAATVILYRAVRGGLEVLMGERSSRHRFMPNRYVFPGGRLDRADWQVRTATALRPAVAARLQRSGSARRGQALALAAIRETFEETGLTIGAADPDPGARCGAAWQAFHATGLAPALGALDYVARAVTPPYRPIRFNARFFMAPGDAICGDIGGSGELLNIHWVDLKVARDLPLPRITALVLDHIEALVCDGAAPDRPVPLYRYHHGRHESTVE